MGKATAKELGVLSLVIPRLTNINRVSTPTAFSKMKGITVHIPIDQNIRPVIQPLRRTPVALQQQINEKIDELLELDIIEKVNEKNLNAVET